MVGSKRGIKPQEETPMKKLSATFLVAFTIFAGIAGSFALLTATATPAMAKCGKCPLYCIGVTCDNGHTYCNSCLAACAGAHNCVTTGF
jgi:hypothetical protein